MNIVTFEQQWSLFTYMVGLHLLSELCEAKAEVIAGEVTEHFLKQEGTREDARAMLAYIEKGIRIGVIEEDGFSSIREFLDFVAAGE